MINLHLLDAIRDTRPEVVSFFGDTGDHEVGMFHTASPVDQSPLRVIATAGEGWDHVSVSLEHRIPCWEEMDFIKRMFFLDTETAMQLHVPPDDHINHHPNCLHLWRPHAGEIPRPPEWMVGPKKGGLSP